MTESRQTAALRAAMDARAVHLDANLLPEVERSHVAVAGLVERLQRMHAECLEDDNDSHAATLAQATDLALAAKRYGYPRPALEQLGAQAGHLPASRTSDPATARVSGERTRSAPTAANHLGRLLRGFLSFERVVDVVRDQGADFDATLTSEELAHRVGLMGSEYAKRCSDLLALGYIRVAQDTNGHDRTRAGDSGRQRLVFELTDDGRRMAASLHV